MQQPNVSRKAHDRACDDQINQSEPGLPRNRLCVEAFEFLRVCEAVLRT